VTLCISCSSVLTLYRGFGASQSTTAQACQYSQLPHTHARPETTDPRPEARAVNALVKHLLTLFVLLQSTSPHSTIMARRSRSSRDYPRASQDYSNRRSSRDHHSSSREYTTEKTTRTAAPQGSRRASLPQYNHNGHKVTKGVHPDGESGRRGFNPIKFLVISGRSSSTLSMMTNLLWPMVPVAIALVHECSIPVQTV
jgi:hypothetical protein